MHLTFQGQGHKIHPKNIEPWGTPVKTPKNKIFPYYLDLSFQGFTPMDVDRLCSSCNG